MYAYCQDMPGVTEEMAARVDAEVGTEPIAGLVAHVSGPSAQGWRIIDVWETEEAWIRFQEERLQPALRVATQGARPPSRPVDVLSVTGVPALTRTGQPSHG
ncbi:MAG TPA: hypothetical protein VKG43_09430 [Acidimicrobiales bacterium]|nr:hypothetical protein [Acidimicrobiales bacterium]